MLEKTYRALLQASLLLPKSFHRLPAELVAARIARSCRVLCEPTAPDGLTVLVFSPDRFREDLDVLGETGALRLIATQTDVLQSVNGLYRTVPPIHELDKYDYFLEEDPKLLEGRRKLRDFCTAVIGALRRRLPFDCAITSAVHYRYEHPWAAACDSQGMPFVALHKEFTVLERRMLPDRIERYRKQKRRFFGTQVLCVNETARELFADSRIVAPDRVEVVGMPRMDRLFDPDSPLRQKSTAQRQVTLFSFAHYCGDLEPGERRSKLFSARDHEGFVRLFENVHVAIAELALAHPEVSFKIKPKVVSDWWIVEIENVIRKALGRGLADIPNCVIAEGAGADLDPRVRRRHRLQLDRSPRIGGARPADHRADLRRGGGPLSRQHLPA